MNHIIHFLLLQLDLTLPKHPIIYVWQACPKVGYLSVCLVNVLPVKVWIPKKFSKVTKSGHGWGKE
jgi:hypothetical protein